MLDNSLSVFGVGELKYVKEYNQQSYSKAEADRTLSFCLREGQTVMRYQERPSPPAAFFVVAGGKVL